MPLQWLEEDDTHPIRPDLPVFRHLTFTEVHSLELGTYIGAFGYFALQFGYGGELIVLLFGLIRYTMGDAKAKAGKSPVTHNIGFHDVREEPPYFGAGFIFGFLAVVVGLRVWSVLGLGPIA